MSWKSRMAATALAVSAASASVAAPQPFPGERNITIPELPREFRASWVATVANIDWPSKPGLSTEEQQKELIAILDQTRNLNMNAVVLQIRPAADALYKSDIEPWSQYLTGEQGKAPEPFYDPLEFAVAESHKRGIELHVWLNPYRARLLKAEKTSTGTVYTPPPTAPNHISITHPEVVKTYGSYQWMDPGEELVQKQSLDVVLDVVNRYDIDGVHMDDYFYPYPIADPETKQEVDFPDEPSWTRYKESGGKLARNDWRRENVNRFIRQLYAEVKKAKPHVLVGLSPFGIWKPGYPEQIKGFNQYEKLYADARLWLNRGWVDYWTPQLYWRIQDLGQSFPVLLKWWQQENTRKRHIWPGLYTTKTSYGADEIINQIVLSRFMGAMGHVHFSVKGLMPKKGGNELVDKLTAATGIYAVPAVAPETTWLGGSAPVRPRNLQVQLVGETTTQTAWVNQEDMEYIPAAEDAPATSTLGQAGDAASTSAQTAAPAAVTLSGQTTATAEVSAADEATTRARRRDGRRPRREAAATTATKAAAAPAAAPAAPRKAVELTWEQPGNADNVRVYGVWTGRGPAGAVSWKFQTVPGGQTSLRIEADDKGNFPAYYAVSAVSRLGQASAYATARYKAGAPAAAEKPRESYGQVQ